MMISSVKVIQSGKFYRFRLPVRVGVLFGG